uniref:Uncharacterized protein n=1 Tax=Knipowitschia caucasica TaxID=637954 RepID=A0AAV2KPI6_KNICA
MMEDYGGCPPVPVRIMYALGIVTLFPCLRDPFSETGYEHFYDPVGTTGFLDTPGLIEQDFAMMFGEEVSNRFLSKWPTFFKNRVLEECEGLYCSDRVDALLTEDGWDSDLSSVLLLVHLLPKASRKVLKLALHKQSKSLCNTYRLVSASKSSLLDLSLDSLFYSAYPVFRMMLTINNV